MDSPEVKALKEEIAAKERRINKLLKALESEQQTVAGCRRHITAINRWLFKNGYLERWQDYVDPTEEVKEIETIEHYKSLYLEEVSRRRNLEQSRPAF